jgi:hypothetical protein
MGEERGFGEDVLKRNSIRAQLRSRFASVAAWCLPAPSADCTRRIPHSELSPAFVAKVAGMHAAIAAQLAEPTRFGGRALTPLLLAQLLPQFAAAGSAQTLLPSGMFVQIQVAEVNRLAIQARDQMILRHKVTRTRWYRVAP